MGIDLHVHSRCSDGLLSPAEVVAAAYASGTKLIALTDHDTLAGLPEAHTAGAAHGVTVVPGIELSCALEGTSIHVLGYSFDPGCEALRAVLDRRSVERRGRIAGMVSRLADLGLSVDLDEVLAEATGPSVGRPHLARVMVRRGLVGSFDEAFRRYLFRGGPAYVPGNSLGASEAIDLLHQAGGVAVLAHPGVEDLDARLPEIAAIGIDGIEVFHADHGSDAVRRYGDWAARQGLFATGGSDFHGSGRHGGRKIGVPGLAEEVWGKVEEAAARRRARR